MVCIEGKRELQVDVKYADPLTVEGFRLGLTWLVETVRHEVQHVGQTLLGVIQGLTEEAGLPSRSIRDLSVDTNGNPRVEGQPQQDHALRDVESYTDLTDAVDALMRLVRRVDPRERADAVREFVALPSGRAQQITPNSHFKTWKTKAPEKWRKAVSEFVKAIGERGVLEPCVG